MAASGTRLRGFPTKIFQNFHVVWLDENIDAYGDLVRRLQHVMNSVNTFTDVAKCVDFINDAADETTFLLVSEGFSRKIIPLVQDMPQVKSVYILTENGPQIDEWNSKCSKINKVFLDIELICENLRKASKICDRNEISISFIKTTDEVLNASKEHLDCSFMYTQILKEILLTIEFTDEQIQDFSNYCRAELAQSAKELEKIDRIQTEYRLHQPIWWYTYESLFYSMVNRALRAMDIDIILKMSFFLCDLHNDITKRHIEQFGSEAQAEPFVVYRGQGLSLEDFQQLKTTQGGLLAFNCFLSTTYDYLLSKMFAESSANDPNLTGVLFQISVDPSISITSFADIKTISYYKEEEEILFSMHSIFRIGDIHPLNDSSPIYKVELTLTNDNDPELRELTEKMKEKTFPGSQGWHRLGRLLMQLAKFEKAEELYKKLEEQVVNQREKALIFGQFGEINNSQGKHPKAIEYYEKAIDILQQSLPVDDSLLATLYGNLGFVYSNMHDYPKALEYYEKDIALKKKTLVSNHADFSMLYTKIAVVHNKMSEYPKALEYYQKVFEILKKNFPVNDPEFAVYYNNIGMVYSNMDEYFKALECFNQSLEIKKRSLPIEHPDVATSYDNIGNLYKLMGRSFKELEYYDKSIEYHQKALEIREKILRANHPNLAVSYNNIGLAYNYMGDFSKVPEYYNKALEYCSKALEIWQTLPSNHLDLAITNSNIGLVYDNMGEHSKALGYYQKSLEIFEKTFPANHPTLVTTYDNIGNAYKDMEEYSKALEYLNKSLEIKKKTLSNHHRSLAASYGFIGYVYGKMGEHSKALEYCKTDLEISKKSLRVNHPHFASAYIRIASIYKEKLDYQQALEYFELALDISNSSLPANHPYIKLAKENIETVKKNL